MRVDLDVKFDEKDYVKSMGAKWDGARRVWYLENPETETLNHLLKYVKYPALLKSSKSKKEK